MRLLKHLKSLRIHLVIILVICLLLAAAYLKNRDIKSLPQTGVTSSPVIIRQVTFSCQDGKTIKAAFNKESVDLSLSDGREKKVEQVETSSGERYATQDDEFVFWTKGVTAFVLEGQATTFADCSEIQTASPRGTGVVTTTGMILCLPHKKQTGAQTMECAYGLKADNGTYYGLADSDPAYKNIAGIPMNKKVEVMGVINLTTSNLYDTIGTITVQSIKQL